ncbi:hypothetical protein A3219_22020 [Salmonella enterica]|nr:hypothetical protein A3219_22020 [Salmonella enterica]
METIERFISPRQLQTLSGVGAFSFNTLYKLVWLKENHPRLRRVSCSTRSSVGNAREPPP